MASMEMLINLMDQKAPKNKAYSNKITFIGQNNLQYFHNWMNYLKIITTICTEPCLKSINTIKYYNYLMLLHYLEHKEYFILFTIKNQAQSITSIFFFLRNVIYITKFLSNSSVINPEK